jgi:hypothetical protein
MAMTPPVDQRNTRDDMVAIASHYPQGLKIGGFVTADGPFADDVYRCENGRLMAGPGRPSGCMMKLETHVRTLPFLGALGLPVLSHLKPAVPAGARTSP